MLNASSPSRSRSSSAPSTIRSLDSPSREPGAACGPLDIDAQPIVHLYRTLVRNAWEVAMSSELRCVGLGAVCAAVALAGAGPASAETGSRQSVKVVFVEHHPGVPSG